MQGHAALARQPFSTEASGQMQGMHAASVMGRVAAHMEKPHISNVPLYQEDAESRKHFRDPCLNYAGTDNSRLHKDPKAAVEEAAGRSGLCCCGQERCWSSKRPVQAGTRPSEGPLAAPPPGPWSPTRDGPLSV